jgi:hypothetical protein
MSFKRFLDRLLSPAQPDQQAAVLPSSKYYEDQHGYFTVRGHGFYAVYTEWLNTKTLSLEKLQALDAQDVVENLDNRSGYVREFCLRSLSHIEKGADAFAHVLLRLNDYVPGNRELALQLVLKWLAAFPLETIVNALPEFESLQAQSRVNHTLVNQGLSQRLNTEEGREALVQGLVNQRAKVRRACWLRCMQTLTWSSAERIRFAMSSGDPAIARSVEPEVFNWPDAEITAWFPKLHTVRAMPLRRAFLVALRRKRLIDTQNLIAFALWDDSFSLRWLARHWAKDEPEMLLQQYVRKLQSEASTRHKRYALEGLAQLKLSIAVDTCAVALGHADPAIRKAALIAICAIDTENQLLHVGAAIEDADLIVVRQAFKQLLALGLPLPTDVIAKTACTRREDFSFFVMLLHYASRMHFWQALHLASFTELLVPNLQPQLAPMVQELLHAVSANHVYVRPTPQQWKAICAWPILKTLKPNSSIRFAIDTYAKKMEGT